jgi:hypothetical protein
VTSWEITLTTRWADGSIGLERLRRAIDLGFPGFVVHQELRERDWESITAFLPRRAVVAVSLFAPLPRTVRPGEGCPFRIGSLHPEERRDAESQGIKTLEMADRAGAAVVLVPPVPLDDPSMDEVLPLLWVENRLPIWEGLRRRRAAAARRHLDSYLSTVSHLLDRADRYGLALALQLGGLPSELPDLDEALRGLTEFKGAPLFLWPGLLQDTQSRRTAGPGPERLQGALSGRVLGISVEDWDGERRRLPLGAGGVDLEDWRWLRDAPAPHALSAGEDQKAGAGAPDEAAGQAVVSDRPPASGKTIARAPSAAEAIRASPLAPPVRIAAIDLVPEVEEEGVLATREALKNLLTPPVKEFDLFTR